jgi:hypothetical protein
LLLGQFGGESVATALPQIGVHCGNLLFEAADPVSLSIGGT